MQLTVQWVDRQTLTPSFITHLQLNS